MTYGMIVRVRAPVDVYHGAHGEVLAALDARKADGLLCHIGRATDAGFEVIEVWESKAAADRFNEEVVVPAMVRAGVALPDPPPELIEFEVLDVMLGKG